MPKMKTWESWVTNYRIYLFFIIIKVVWGCRERCRWVSLHVGFASCSWGHVFNSMDHKAAVTAHFAANYSGQKADFFFFFALDRQNYLNLRTENLYSFLDSNNVNQVIIKIFLFSCNSPIQVLHGFNSR